MNEQITAGIVQAKHGHMNNPNDRKAHMTEGMKKLYGSSPAGLAITTC